MSREIKIGILAIVAFACLLWGYNFVKGQNLFTTSLTVFTKYEDVTGLDVSAPVYVNGFQVGSVKKITLNPDDVSEMIVEIRIEGELNLPSDTKAVMRSDGLVSGNAIALKFDKPCDNNCLEDNQFIESEVLGLLGSMLTEDEMDEMSTTLSGTANAVLDDLGRADSNAPVNVAVRELTSTMQNMTKMTEATNDLIRQSSSSIQLTMANMAKITKNLADSNEKITSMIDNMTTITQKLADSDLDKVSNNAATTLKEAEVSLKNLSKTMNIANTTFTELGTTLTKMNEGDGSLAKLLTDKELYDNLASTSKNMSLLLQDMRLNPKRYVSISVFGKQSKNYVKPEDDPAYKE